MMKKPADAILALMPKGKGEDEDIELLVDMRIQVGELRRALSAHRSAIVALTHPELEALGDHASSERFQYSPSTKLF